MPRLALPLVLLLAAPPVTAQPADPPPVVLAIHGGAGTIERGSMPPERAAAYRAALEAALRAGSATDVRIDREAGLASARGLDEGTFHALIRKAGFTPL